MKKKVLIYNWIQFDDANMRGGGVSVYLKNIIKEYCNHNYAVTFLSSGEQYSLITRKVFYEKTSNIYENQGVNSYRIVNSPIVAPAHHSFGKILDCRENQEIADKICDFISEKGLFDEIHIHNIEGISTKTIEQIKNRWPNIKIAVWMHNYHWICPQIELFKNHKKICKDYHDGADCFGCLSFIQDSEYIKRAQKIKRLASKLRIANTRFESVFYDFIRVGSDFVKVLRGLLTIKPSRGSESWEIKIDAEKENLKNMESIGGFYKDWREINLQRLNSNVDIIFAVSRQVKEVFESYGVEESLIRSVPLGMDVYRPKKEVLARARNEWNNKLRIAFFGYPIPSKGLDFFLEALSAMPNEYCDKLSILIVSKIDDWSKRKAIRLSKKMEVKILPGYQRSELPEIAKKVDLGVVPSLWLETYNQVSYELIMEGVPVLVSNTVGIKEFVSRKFVFYSNDKNSLLSVLTQIIGGKMKLTDFWDNYADLPKLTLHFKSLDLSRY